MSEATQYPSALPISLLLALHGFRKGSLSPTGAVAAFAAGYGHIANPLKVFGVTLIAFYFLGSRATKVKIEQKAKLEDGPDPSKPGGNRNAVQVLSSCLPSLLAALYYRYGVPALDSATCPSTSIIHKQLIYVALGQLSTAFADTLASELGILSPSAPVYLLTLRPVPPGTNGGVSLYGLIASIVGGLVIGGVMVTDLLVERAGCRADSGFAVDLIIFGVLSGFLGSLLDSLLGAVAQQTLYSTKDKKILTDHSTRSSKEPGLQKIGDGRDILSNSAVNFASGSAMAAFGWWWASR